jgi:isopentenyl-diphosphate delta-isomerase
MELIILVDDQDRQIGVEEKLAGHRNGGRLHRAFSVLIFNRRGEMLLQQRSAQKYHFRGMWTNACCGHPRPGEALEGSAHRRLREELGFDTALREMFSFVYTAEDPESGLTECEFDHVFVGEFDGTPQPHPDEVSALRWLAKDELERELAVRPDCYSSWFREAFTRMMALAAWPSGERATHSPATPPPAPPERLP